MKTILPFRNWSIRRFQDQIIVGMCAVDGAVLWEKIEPSNLPNDLVGLRDGELVWILPGGIDMKTFDCEVCNVSAADRVNAVKRPNLLRRLFADDDSVLGAFVRGAIETLVLRPAVGISRWCHGVLNSSTNNY